jgi:hypothetical protein
MGRGCVETLVVSDAFAVIGFGEAFWPVWGHAICQLRKYQASGGVFPAFEGSFSRSRAKAAERPSPTPMMTARGLVIEIPSSEISRYLTSECA